MYRFKVINYSSASPAFSRFVFLILNISFVRMKSY